MEHNRSEEKKKDDKDGEYVDKTITKMPTIIIHIDKHQRSFENICTVVHIIIEKHKKHTME